MHGKGTYHYTSGAIYSGTWVAGKQEGFVIAILSIIELKTLTNRVSTSFQMARSMKESGRITVCMERAYILILKEENGKESL